MYELYLIILFKWTNCGTLWWHSTLLLIYQNIWKHSTKQLGAGKRKCKGWEAKTQTKPKQKTLKTNKGKKEIKELKANCGPNSLILFHSKWERDLASSDWNIYRNLTGGHRQHTNCWNYWKKSCLQVNTKLKKLGYCRQLF